MNIILHGLYGLAGYICGSIPFGVWIPKWLKKEDPRHMGSGSIGATNVYRLAGIKVAALVYICDFLKGFLPVLMVPQDQKLVVGSLCVLGHIFSFFLRFKGGKGIATASGVLAVIMPVHFFICLGVWLVIVQSVGYVSLASLAAVLLNLCLTWIFFDVSHIFFSLFLTGLLIYTHRSNLVRLWKGKEGPIHSFKQKKE